MNENIGIRMAGSGIKAPAFMKAVANFFRVAAHVSDDWAAGSDSKVNWIVTVREGSNIVLGTPRITGRANDSAALLVGFLVAGYNEIVRGSTDRPRHFNDSALESVRTLASLAAGGTDFESLEIQSNGSSVQIEASAINTVDAILGRVHKSFGEIEGRLSVLIDHGDFKFHVQEPIHGEDIACYITQSELIDAAVAAFRKRVSVSGLIKYRRNGTPVSIDADSIRVFDDESPFPRVNDVVGIYRR